MTKFERDSRRRTFELAQTFFANVISENPDADGIAKDWKLAASYLFHVDRRLRLAAISVIAAHCGLNQDEELDKYFITPLMFISQFEPDLALRVSATDAIGDLQCAKGNDQVNEWLKTIIRNESLDNRLRAAAYSAVLRLRSDKRGFLQPFPLEEGFPDYVDWSVVND